jgi:hypothetical protein
LASLLGTFLLRLARPLTPLALVLLTEALLITIVVIVFPLTAKWISRSHNGPFPRFDHYPDLRATDLKAHELWHHQKHRPSDLLDLCVVSV